jgi:peroxiredoxin
MIGSNSYLFFSSLLPQSLRHRFKTLYGALQFASEQENMTLTERQLMNGRHKGLAHSSEEPRAGVIENGKYGLETSKHSVSLKKKGDTIEPMVLTTIQEERIQVPDSEHLVHLQFRRFAGCPVCNLHPRSIAKRHDEIVEAGIKEVVLFYSTRETMLEFQGTLPFEAVADPGKKLYAKFGADRKASPIVVLNPRVWVTIISTALALARSPTLKGTRRKEEEPMGLPSDFLIDTDGKILGVNYGKRVDDHWSVEELLNLARKA